jgi:hypothetical protein
MKEGLSSKQYPIFISFLQILFFQKRYLTPMYNFQELADFSIKGLE